MSKQESSATATVDGELHPRRGDLAAAARALKAYPATGFQSAGLAVRAVPA